MIPESTQETPRPNSQHKGDLLAPEGQRAVNKRQKQEGEEENKRGKEEGERDISARGTKDCPWIERRQMWLICKWHFIKGKKETQC